MLRRFVWFVAVVSSYLAATSGMAAKVEYLPRVTRVLNEDFSAVDPALIITDGMLQPRDEPYVLEVEVRLRVSELGDERGFAGSKFDINVTSDGTTRVGLEDGVLPWNPVVVFDCNGPAPGGATFDILTLNQDEEADLQGIELLVNDKEFGTGPLSCGPELRRSFGQSSSGEVIGHTYVELPGQAGSRTSIDTAAPYDVSVFMFDADGETFNAGLIGLGGSSGIYQVVPEPSSFLLAAMGACMVLVRRLKMRTGV